MEKVFDFFIQKAEAAIGFGGCASFQYTYRFDSNNNPQIVGSVTMTELTVQCPSKSGAPTGALYSSASGVTMNYIGAERWQCQTGPDTIGRVYTTTLQLLNTAASTGQQFGSVTLTRENPGCNFSGSGPQTYAQFPVINGTPCNAGTATCVNCAT